ncbi:MAG: helix-turn-helix domain-containing protein, partial [Alphaproteobacteria bacterium]|nr:helix-turn-helix domain-containing protein [Alphaproteobacteria bacterium]
MNKLDTKARAQILHLLCEGQSIRAITRITGASKNTVTKLLIDVGKACAAYHDERVCNVKASRIQCDEIWSFTYAKQKNVATAKRKDLAYGDTWTWTA